MRFEIKANSHEKLDVPLGPRGLELNGFLPNSCEWEQINYGQGEGQVIVDGNEWGFYYSSSGGISVILHVGIVSLSEATAFVDAVAAKIGSHGNSVSVFLVGVASDV